MPTTIDGSASVTINNGAVLGITSGTAVASTSGTSIDFTGLPSWVKRVTVMFSGVSTNGTSIPLLQIGSAGAVEITGYTGSGTSAFNGNAVSGALQTTGFGIGGGMAATVVFQGSIVLTLMNSTGNIWVASGTLARSDTAVTFACGGVKSLTSTLDRVRITTVNGTDTFDAGSINILYEG
jgi:hypothetical protein